MAQVQKEHIEDNGVSQYYSRVGSWLGYNLVMGRSQHAGYWQKNTLTEKQAQQNYLNKLVDILAISADETALDAGSGQGYVARHLAETTQASITGITITPREVGVAKKLSEKLEPSPEFVLGDYSETNFPDGSFDVVYSVETLSHAKDMRKTMREFYRVLRPGGRIALFDYEVDSDNFTAEEKQATDFLVQHAGGYGLYRQKPGEITSALKEAGFRDNAEKDWSSHTKPTYDRLRRIARPVSWIRPTSRLAPYFVNAVMATHWYSNLYESGRFRYIIYTAKKPGQRRER